MTNQLGRDKRDYALQLVRKWHEEEEGRTLEDVLRIDEMSRTRSGRPGFNEQFVAMCKAIVEAEGVRATAVASRSDHDWQPDGGALRFESHPGGEAPHVHTTCAQCGARAWFLEYQWELLAKGCVSTRRDRYECPHTSCAYPGTCRDAGHCVATEAPSSASAGAAPSKLSTILAEARESDEYKRERETLDREAASAVPSTIEQCAQVCDGIAQRAADLLYSEAAKHCAEAIRKSARSHERDRT